MDHFKQLEEKYLKKIAELQSQMSDGSVSAFSAKYACLVQATACYASFLKDINHTRLTLEEPSEDDLFTAADVCEILDTCETVEEAWLWFETHGTYPPIPAYIESGALIPTK